MHPEKIDLHQSNTFVYKPGRKKILFACVPADGHFSPLTGIAKHLQSIGYDVRWYSSAAYKDRLGKLQIPYYPFEKGLEVTGDTADEIFPPYWLIYHPPAWIMNAGG